MYIKKKKTIYSNNPEKSYTEEKAIHKPFGWSMFTRYPFDKRENKLNYYKGKNLKEIPVIIHNASYDTHFILKQLAK